MYATNMVFILNLRRIKCPSSTIRHLNANHLDTQHHEPMARNFVWRPWRQVRSWAFCAR